MISNDFNRNLRNLKMLRNIYKHVTCRLVIMRGKTVYIDSKIYSVYIENKNKIRDQMGININFSDFVLILLKEIHSLREKVNQYEKLLQGSNVQKTNVS